MTYTAFKKQEKEMIDTKLHVMSIGGEDDLKQKISTSAFRSTLKSQRKSKKVGKKEIPETALQFRINQVSSQVSPQMSPALPSHTIQNSLYPLGAHYSGYYSKIKLGRPVDIFESPIMSPSQRSPSRAITADSIRNDDMLSPLQKMTPNVTRPSPVSTVSAITGHHKEINLECNDLLLKLTDSDQSFNTVLKNLQELNKMVQRSSLQYMFDQGIVSILLPIYKNFPEDLEIQAIITSILVDIYEVVDKAKDVFVKLDLIPILLKAASNASKALIEEEHKNFENIEFIQGRRASTAIQARRMSGMGNTMALNSGHEEKGLRRMSYVKKNRKSLTHSFREDSTEVLMRSSNLNKDSIIDGLLIKYYQPNFLNTFNSSDQEYRLKTLKHILTQFEKIDKILIASSSTSLDIEIDQALRKILAETEDMMQAELVVFYEIDTNNGDLILKTFNETEEQMLGTRKTFPAGSGIAGFAVASKEMINVSDALNFPHYNSAVDNGGSPHIRPEQVLSCPLFVKNGPVIAVVQLVNKLGENGETKAFDQEDEYLLRLLARTLTIVLTNTRSISKITETRKKVQVLLDTTKSLSSITGLDALIKKIMESAKELLSADRCTLFLKDTARKQLVAKILVRDSIEEIRIKMDAGIAGSVLMSGDSVNIKDAYRDSRFNSDVDKQTGYVTKTILCVPIKNIDGECIGVTQMINKRNGIFTEEDENMLSSFSAQAAVALAKTELFQKTEEMRLYQHSILSSITSCVITLNDGMRMVSMNRPLVMNAIGVTEDVMRDNPINKWIGSDNQTLLSDVLSVFKHGQPIFVAEYEIKGRNSVFVNYQIVPLTGTSSNGLVLVFDDISSEKKAVMTLGRYMSPELAKQVLQENNAQLGGTRKNVSILFSDIRSFTKLSESMEPHEVVELLNQHFTGAVNAIIEEHGILDKFIGDAVMAVFGVPFGTPEDPINSCNAALRMREAVKILNEQRNSIGLKGITIGIGINTGLVLSGNIGSQKRMEYSCIGDNVNLASRTEGLTKTYGVEILITENTFIETNDQFHVREIDSVIVTGKSKPVKIYELLGKKSTPLSDVTIKSMQLYKEGLKCYKSRNFEGAMSKFQKGSALYKDGPCSTMMERSAKYLIQPPEDDWEGVYVAEGK